MAKKNDDGMGMLIGLIIFFVILAFIVLKWLIIGLIVIISTVVYGIINLVKKIQNNKIKQEVNEKHFVDSTIKPKEEIDIKQLKKQIGIFDISEYDELFEPQIMRRGYTYFVENKIKDVHNNGQIWSCHVEGTKTYNTTIEFDEEDKNRIKRMECNCPHYLENNKNCKHIYALLYLIKSTNNSAIIVKEITKYSNRLSDMIKEEKHYIQDNNKKIKVDKYELDYFNKLIKETVEQLKNIQQDLDKHKFDEQVLLNDLIKMIKQSYALDSNFEKIILNSNIKENPISLERVMEYNGENEEIGLGTALAGAMLVDDIIEGDRKSKESKKLEKEMDFWNLEEEERDFVRRGEYNPDNFEWEDNLTEDDYNYEEYKEENE